MPDLKVPRTTGTYADVLTALGLAELIVKEGVTPTIREGPDAFSLELPRPPTFTTKRRLYRFIRGDRDDSDKRPGEIDYGRLKAAWSEHFEFLKKTEKNQEARDGYIPPLDLDNRTLITSLVDLLKPIQNSAYNKTSDTLVGMTNGQYQAFASALTDYFDPHNTATFEKCWKARAEEGDFKGKVSAVQAFNPMMGKGMNARKANSVSMSQLKEWLPIEALKFTGWWVGIITATPKKSKDRKVLCAVPADIGYENYRDVMEGLRKNFRGGGSVQIDVRAALELSRTLLEYHPEREPGFYYPKEAISGLYSAYFKNLGSAKGVSNLSLISLPSWVAVDLGDVEKEIPAWSEILSEHLAVVGRLDESRADQYNLLLNYRDFMSSDSLDAFLDFLIAYGVFALAKVDREKTHRAARWFDSTGLRKVMLAMDENLSKILEDEGFQNVAAAIRRATRGAVYAKLRGNKTYPVHYGLAQDLNRKARYKIDFIGALADFATEYNSENLRVSERLSSQDLSEEDKRKRRRPDLSTEDIAATTKLLDTCDSTTVAKLLIAFGYAKGPQDPADPDPETDSGETGEGFVEEEVEA